MVLQAEHAVAQIQNRRAAVALHLAAGGADGVQGNFPRVGRHRLEATPTAQLQHAPGRLLLVKAHPLALGGDLLSHPPGDGVAGRLHLGGGLLHAQGVPGLERPALPAESPAQGAVDFDDAVGDLAQPVGRVDQRLVEHGARQRRRPVVAVHHPAHLLVDVLGAARHAQRRIARLLLWAVRQRRQIDLQDVVAHLLVEALLGLAA